MNGLSLIGVLAAAGTAMAAQAAVTSFGKGCSLAAEQRDTSPQAIELCDSALEVVSLSQADRVAAHINRGILYLHRSDVKRAAADFDRALALDPEQPEAWLNKAILIVRDGDGAEALPMIEKALAFKTRRPALAYYVRGIVEERRGNIRGAYRAYRRAQDLEPDWDDPAVELRRFNVRQPRPGKGAA